MSRPQILIILYTCTSPSCRITAVLYLPTPLTFLLLSYTQVVRSVDKVILTGPVSSFSLTVRTVTLK
jgi:hypothetical protein